MEKYNILIHTSISFVRDLPVLHDPKSTIAPGVILTQTCLAEAVTAIIPDPRNIKLINYVLIAMIFTCLPSSTLSLLVIKNLMSTL